MDFRAIFLKISRCVSKYVGLFWNVTKYLRSFLVSPPIFQTLYPALSLSIEIIGPTGNLICKILNLKNICELISQPTMEFLELVFMLLIAWSLRAWLKISWIWGFNFFRMLTIYSIFCVDADFDGQICYCECWLSAQFFVWCWLPSSKNAQKEVNADCSPPPILTPTSQYAHQLPLLIWDAKWSPNTTRT